MKLPDDKKIATAPLLWILRSRKAEPQHTLYISRHGLWLSLKEAVGEGKILYRKVVEVDLSGGPKPVVRFEDGGEEEADLVVGADGVRSVVKKGVFGAEDEGVYAPHYE